MGLSGGPCGWPGRAAPSPGTPPGVGKATIRAIKRER
jgi:hypothetical protein